MASQGTQVISSEVLEAASTPAFVRDAVADLQRGAFEEARQRLEAGLREGRTVVALLALAEAYWDDPDTKARDPKRSIEFLKEAIQLAPKDARPYALLGRYLLSKGLRDQALNFLDRAVALDPNDASSRRLRDRASLQKKKQYTVVVNAADLMAEKQPKKPGASGAEQHKREATRILTVDPKRAAEELEKAEHGEDASIDRALGALLGVELFEADVSLLREGAAGRRRGGILRTVLAFALVALTGLAFGGVVHRLAPSGAASPEAELEALLVQDTPGSLARLIERSAEVEDPRAAALSALAHVSLLRFHGADEGHVQSAEDLLETALPEVRRTPEALYARALLREVPIADDDPDLDADLDAARGDETLAEGPWLALGLAARATQRGDDTGSLVALTRAALSRGAPPRAQLELARAYAERGQLDLAARVLERLERAAPRYVPGLIAGIALAALRAETSTGNSARKVALEPQDGEDAKESENNESSALPARAAIEARALALLEEGELEAGESAPLALMLSAMATARGDAKVAGLMLQRAQERGVPKAYPGLLSRLSELILLDLGDFSRAYDLLTDGLRTYPGELRLLVDLARARAVRGLSEERVRHLRTNAARALRASVLDLPLGRFEIDLSERYVPLRPVFDARFFPEDAIRTALDIKGLTAQAAERRLSVVASLKLAELALAQNDVAKAEDHVTIARKEAPTNPEVHLSLALIRSKNGDAVRARESIEEALAIAPDDPRILLAAAGLQLESNDLAAARRSLDRLDQEGFTSPAALALASRVSLQERDVRRARALLARASELGQDDLGVLAASLALEHEAGAPLAARRAASRVAEVAPERAARIAERDPVARAYLAWAALERGQAEVAEREVAEVVRERPGLAAGHLVQGEVLVHKRATDEALSAFGEAQRLDPGGAIGARAKERIIALGGTVEEPRRRGGRRRR